MIFIVWELREWLHRHTRAKNKGKTLPHPLPNIPIFSSWRTHTYTTPAFWPYHYWFACYRPGRLQVATISSHFWNMRNMAHRKVCAMYINLGPCVCKCNTVAWKISKRGFWEGGCADNSEKEKQTLCTLPHPLSDTPMKTPRLHHVLSFFICVL